jgi:hypothetical protein
VKRIVLTFVTSGLWLVGCDKPGSADTHKGDAMAAARTARRSHAPHGETPGSAAALRVILNTALGIASTAAREKALADVAWNALEIDPGLACDAFQHLPTGSPEKIRLLQHYAMRLAEQDLNAALAWAATLESDPEIAAARGQIALVLAESDPQRAAGILSESGIVGRDFDVAVVQVMHRWAARSPADAAAWAVLFPPGPVREAGMKIIAGLWMQRDAPGALGWLSGLEDEDVREEAACAMEGVILQQNDEVRDGWLQHADAGILSELQQQQERAIMEVGDNIPPPEKYPPAISDTL